MTPTIISISIIIPNFNGAKFLSECLLSLFMSMNNYPSAIFEIILVDNGSSDNSVEIFKNFCQTHKLNFRVLALHTNQGFSTAVNLGIEKSTYNLVCLVNNDLIIHPDWFKLVGATISKSDKNTAAFCGTILTKDGQYFESQGLIFDIKGKCNNVNNGLSFSAKALSIHSSVIPIWGCSAALVIYKKNIIKKIGLLDNDFFAYEEDVDLALRLNNLKYQTLLTPLAISYHLGGGTSNNMGNFRNIHDAKNWFFIIIKNYSLKTIIFNLPQILIERLRNLSGLIKNTIRIDGLKSLISLPLALYKSYVPIIFKFPAMLVKRSQIKSLLKLNQT